MIGTASAYCTKRPGRLLARDSSWRIEGSTTARLIACIAFGGLLGAVTLSGCSRSPKSFSFVDRLDEATIRGDAREVRLEEDLPDGHIDGRKLLSPHIEYHPLATIVRVKSSLSHSAHSQLEAIYSPANSEIRFPMAIPPNSRLEFSPGIIGSGSESGSPGLTYRFGISFTGRSLQASGDGVSLYSQVFSQKELEGGDIGIETVDLSHLGGESGELAFITTPVAERSLASTVGSAPLVWLDPRFIVQQDPQRGKTILLIVMDTVSATRTTLAGYSVDTTPQLQRLASRGLVFDRALAASPWTLTSFGSLFMMTSSAIHGAGFVDPSDARKRTSLSRKRQSFAEILRAAGWRTEAWINNPYLSESKGFSRGFEAYTDYATLWDRIGVRPAIDQILERLEDASDQDVFYFLHVMDPHTPYKPPESFVREFVTRCRDVKDISEPPCGYPDSSVLSNWGAYRVDFPKAQRGHVLQFHEAALRYADSQLGRLYGRILDSDFDPESTLVIVTADHGEEFWEHDRYEHGHSQYNELLHVPLVVYGGGAAPGSRDEPVSLQDVGGTILRFAGVRGASRFPSLPLSGGIADDNPAIASAHVLYGNEKWAVQDRDWKYIYNGQRDSTQPSRARPNISPFELYHISEDPEEQKNLFGEPFAVVEKLHQSLESASIDYFRGHYLVAATGAPDDSHLELTLELRDQRARWENRFYELMQPRTGRTEALDLRPEDGRRSMRLTFGEDRGLVGLRSTRPSEDRSDLEIRFQQIPKNLRFSPACGSAVEVRTAELYELDAKSMIPVSKALDCLRGLRERNSPPTVLVAFICEGDRCERSTPESWVAPEERDEKERLENLRALGYIQ